MPRNSINRVTLVGNLGADPETRFTPKGTQVTTARLATDDRWMDNEGNTQSRTEWHKLVFWRRLAEITAKMEFFAMDILIPEGHYIRLSLRDIGEDYMPSSTEAAVDIELGEDSVLRLHEINVDNKIFFEPPVCTHTDCLEE